MTIYVISEESHGFIGTATTFKVAKQFLLASNWINTGISIWVNDRLNENGDHYFNLNEAYGKTGKKSIWTLIWIPSTNWVSIFIKKNSLKNRRKTNMFEELRCPHCETEMETIVCGDVEVTTDCYVPCRATCPTCGRKYKMFEVYTFVGYEEMEEV